MAAGQSSARNRATLLRRSQAVIGTAVAVVVLVAGLLAVLPQVRSFHEVIWWWRVGDRSWLTWTIRGLAIYGLVAFAGIIAVLASEGSGSTRRGSKRRMRRRSTETNGLFPTLLFLVVTVAAFVVLAVMCSLIAPFLGLVGIVLAYTFVQEVRTPRGGE